MNKTQNNLLTTLFITCIFCLLLTGCGVSGNSKHSEKVNPFDYIQLEYTGYNSQGVAHINFDNDIMIENIIGYLDENSDENDFSKWFAQYCMYDENVSVECSKDEGLTNGDEIVVNVTVEGEAAKKILPGTKIFKVEGLEEVTKVDVFTDLEVVYEGIDGQGTVKIKNTSTDEFISKIKFYIDEENSSASSYSLSNGDSVSIVASCDEELIDEYLQIPEKESLIFTVSGLPISVSAKDLSHDFIDEIKQYAYEIVLNYLENNANYYTFDNLKYECTYFYDNEYRNDYYTPDKPKTELVVFYSLDRSESYGSDVFKTMYYGVSFSSAAGEMVLYPDGAYKVISRGTIYDIDSTSGNVDVLEDNLETAIAGIKPQFEDDNYYTKTKID